VNPSADFAVEDPWIVVENVGTTYAWTVSFALRVPVDAAGDIRPDLRIYGSSWVYDPGFTSGTTWELPVLCTSSSLSSNDCLILPDALTDLPGDLPIGNLEDSWSVLRSDC
jgi:hypothetical protein